VPVYITVQYIVCANTEAKCTLVRGPQIIPEVRIGGEAVVVDFGVTQTMVTGAAPASAMLRDRIEWSPAYNRQSNHFHPDSH